MIAGLPTNDPEELLKRDRFPVWFFTNEQMAHFWKQLPTIPGGNAFGVAGAGDWALNLASLNIVQNVHLVDNRALALVTLEMKYGLLKIFNRSTFQTWFQTTDELPANIAKHVSPLTLFTFQALVNKHGSLRSTLCDRKYWYKESWHALRNSGYLAYLESDEAYEAVQTGLNEFQLSYGDVRSVLQTKEKNSLGLVYLSNLLDSKKYVANPSSVLSAAKDKLAVNGILVCVTQHKPDILQRLAEKAGFRILLQERHPFNLWKAMRGYYQYSFVVFQT